MGVLVEWGGKGVDWEGGTFCGSSAYQKLTLSYHLSAFMDSSLAQIQVNLWLSLPKQTITSLGCRRCHAGTAELPCGACNNWGT